MRRTRPPRLAQILVRWFGPRRDHEFLVGDLAEGYGRRSRTDRRAARRWYRAQVLAAIIRTPVWRGLWLDSIGHALRHSIRGLFGHPALTTVAIVSLALGIGWSTAIFSVTDRMLLRTMDVEAPDDLFVVTTDASQAGVVTNPIWEAFRDREDFLAAVFAIGDTTFERVRDGQVERILGAWVSGEFFNALGIGVASGRPIIPADDHRGCPAVAVLGHGYWQSEFGGADVIGEPIVLNDQPVEIVGVAAAGLRGLTTGLATRVFLPLCAEAVIRGDGSMLDSSGIWSLRMVARRQPGMTVEQLTAALDTVAPAIFESTVYSGWEGERRAGYLGASFDVRSAARGLTRVSDGHARSLWIMWSLGGLVVLAACANLATLLLARGEARQREVAIQAALGADRWRIFGQALTESFLLAAIGSALGLAIAVWASRALVALMSTRWESLSIDLSLDLRVLAFTAALTTVTALLFGFGPALHATRVDGASALLARSGGGSRLTAGRVSVVAQVAMSVVLVVAAVLLGGTFWNLVTLDAGFHRRGVVVVDVDASRSGIDADSLRSTYRETLRRLRNDPGVVAASVANITPISGSWQTHSIVVDGDEPGDAGHEVWMNEVGDGYFATFGTRMVDGRDFTEDDVAGVPPVAVVNRTLARGIFGSLDVVGRTFRLRQSETELGEPFRIVGVVQDAKYASLQEPEPPTVYFALFQRPRLYPWMTFQVLLDRSIPATAAGGPSSRLPPTVSAALAAIGPDVRLSVDTLADRIDDSLGPERMLAILSALFGAAALSLCAIGLHGIVSYGVARRTHEISVRTALGATRRAVLRLILLDAGRLVGAGALLGIAVSLAGRRALDAFAYGISPSDPRPLVAAVTLMLVIAWLSCLRPARRATANDPIQALRAE